MKQYKFIFLFLLSGFLAFGLWSCDDDPTGPDLDEEPEPPDFQEVEMDFDIFNDSGFAGDFSTESDAFAFSESDEITREQSPYNFAASYAMSAGLVFEIMALYPQTFFQRHHWGDPELEGDTWVWEVDISAIQEFEDDEIPAEHVSMRVTAEDTGGAWYWELRYSINTEEEQIDNALMMSAQIFHDGSGGDWQIYDFEEQEIPVFDTSYELEDDITQKVELTFNDLDLDQEASGSFVYERFDETNRLDINDPDYDEPATVEWNRDSGVGYIQSPDYRDGELVCWDEEFEETDECLI